MDSVTLFLLGGILIGAILGAIFSGEGCGELLGSVVAGATIGGLGAAVLYWSGVGVGIAFGQYPQQCVAASSAIAVALYAFSLFRRPPSPPTTRGPHGAPFESIWD